MTNTLGIDASTYQPDLNLSTVHTEGARFGVFRLTRGTDYVDPYYNDHMKQAEDLGWLAGAYHFLYRGNGTLQANKCYAAMKKTGWDVPITLDWEHSTKGGSPGVSDAVDFRNQIMALGVKPGFLYLPRWYWTQINKPELDKWMRSGWKLWNSHYWKSNNKGSMKSLANGFENFDGCWNSYGTTPVTMGQYTASAVIPRYLRNTVDANMFLGTRAELAALGNLRDFTKSVAPKPVPNLVPVPVVKPHYPNAEAIVIAAKRGIAASTSEDRRKKFEQVLKIGQELS